MALEKAAQLVHVDLDRRLNDSVEIRKQIEKERGLYLDRDDFDREHTLLADRIRDVELAQAKYAGGILLVVALLQVITQFIGHYLSK